MLTGFRLHIYQNKVYDAAKEIYLFLLLKKSIENSL